MGQLTDKVTKLLDECRILILACQVVLAVMFRATFEQGFANLPLPSRLIVLAGAALVSFSLAVLLAPASYHVIVERGEDSGALQRFATKTIEIAMVPFALGLGVQLYVAFEIVVSRAAAQAAAVLSIAMAMFFWYFLEWLHRQKPVSNRMYQPDEIAPTDIHKKVDHVLQEARMALPGAQALLGFQFASFLSASFDQLPSVYRVSHLFSLCAIAVSTILLIAPAAWHRIVEAGEDSERFHRIASRFLLFAMAFLANGLALEFAVAIYTSTASSVASVIGGILLATFCYGLWFVYMLLNRSHRWPEQYPS